MIRPFRQGGALTVLRYGMVMTVVATAGLASAGSALITLSMLIDVVRGGG